MCTVVYIRSHSNVYFASLRDESPERLSAIAPLINIDNAIKFISPVDALAGGTWAGVNENKTVIILLNGAFGKHHKKPFYRKSRGLIVSELLSAEMPVADWKLMDMKDIEPYTLVVLNDNKLFELVWDGTKKHSLFLDDTKPHIWSSSTLYNSAAKKIRADLYHNWTITEPSITKITLLDFFKSYCDIMDGFIMNRNETVKTLSYSFITIEVDGTAQFEYDDFKENNQEQQICIPAVEKKCDKSEHRFL